MILVHKKSKTYIVICSSTCTIWCDINYLTKLMKYKLCQNLVVFGLRVDPNPELRHPPSPASLGERKGKVVHHARFGRNACLPVLGRMPASREDLTVKVPAIYHQMDLGFIKAATLTTRSKSRPQSWPRDLNYNRNYNQVLGWVNEEIICISTRCYLYNGKMSTGFGEGVGHYLYGWVAHSLGGMVMWPSSSNLIGCQLS